jgi:hypothetical protein
MRAGAGGDEQVVVAHALAVEHDLAAGGVERPDRPAEAQVDALLGVPAGGPERDVGIGGQGVLGQRRPVVRPHRLGGEDRHRPLVAGGAQHLTASLGGQTAPRDHQAAGSDICPCHGVHHRARPAKPRKAPGKRLGKRRRRRLRP